MRSRRKMKTMSRVNKFRAYDEEHKLMIYSDNQPYGYEWEINEHNGVICMQYDYVDDDFGGNVYYSDHLPIMQYTGLKDKNGKEIYEGDIVNCRVLRLSGNYGSWNQDRNIEHGKCRIIPMEVYYVEPYTNHFKKFGGIDFRPTAKAKELIKEYEKPIGRETKRQIINWYNIDKDDLVEVIGNIYENPELLEVE